MNIHEYQAKELFDRFAVPSPKGRVASTPKEAYEAARWLGVNHLVVKAQVHAGGRGKGVFKNGFKGGVHLVDTPEAARDVAGRMLGETLVTKQTGDAGRMVRKVMVTESVQISRELYLAILLDRQSCRPVIIVSTEGG
jgi:succinyl-CoA synthetase beta subunit